MPDMLPHRDFGATGRRAPVLGLGGAFLDEASPEQGVRAVHAALDLGVRYFDTSPMYCRGASQDILGRALVGRPETITLATKIGYLPNPADHRDLALIREQIDDNLRRLRRDHVDLLQIHEADLARWWIDGAGPWARVSSGDAFDVAGSPAVQAMTEARDRGQCSLLGVSGNDAAAMTAVLSQAPVDSLLLAFNYDLLHRAGRREAIPLAVKRGCAVVLGGVLHCGRLASVRPDWLEQPPDWLHGDLLERFRRLYALQAEAGLSLPALTVRYLLADPRISVILVGSSTPGQLAELVEAAAAGPLPGDLHQTVEALADTSADADVG